MCILNIFVKFIIFIDWCYNGIQILIYAGGKKKPLKAPKKQSKEMDDVSSGFCWRVSTWDYACGR